MVCDSNIVIYSVEPEDMACRAFMEDENAIIASVPRIEVLGYPGFQSLSPERRLRLESMVASTAEAGLDEEIIQRAISLRQDRKMSLGDSIIAATALEYGLPLVTRNTDDFRHIAGLTSINPFSAP